MDLSINYSTVNMYNAVEESENNNETSTSKSIYSIINLARYAEEATHYRYQIEKYRDLVYRDASHNDELQQMMNCACFWEGKFISEIQKNNFSKNIIEKLLQELNEIIFVEESVKDNIKYYLEWYEMELRRGATFN